MSENTASGLRVAVLGAHGRMGSEAVRAVEAAEGLDLVAALDHSDSLQAVSYTHLTLPTILLV